MQQLLDAMLLAHGVHVGNLVVGQVGEVQVDLQDIGSISIYEPVSVVTTSIGQKEICTW